MEPERIDNAIIIERRSVTFRIVVIYFLRFLRVVSVICLLGALASNLMIMISVLPMKMPFKNRIFYFCSSLGFSLLALLQIIAEFSPKCFFKYAKLFDLWLFKGILLTWQGVQTLSNTGIFLNAAVDKYDWQVDNAINHTSDNATDHSTKENDLIIPRLAMEWTANVFGYSLIGIGGILVLFSIFFLRTLLRLDDPLYRGETVQMISLNSMSTPLIEKPKNETPPQEPDPAPISYEVVDSPVREPVDPNTKGTDTEDFLEL